MNLIKAFPSAEVEYCSNDISRLCILDESFLSIRGLTSENNQGTKAHFAHVFRPRICDDVDVAFFRPIEGRRGGHRMELIK